MTVRVASPNGPQPIPVKHGPRIPRAILILIAATLGGRVSVGEARNYRLSKTKSDVNFDRSKGWSDFDEFSEWVIFLGLRRLSTHFGQQNYTFVIPEKLARSERSAKPD